MKNSIYIKILEYGEDAGINGLSHDEILEKLKSAGLINGEIDLVIENRITSIFYECFEKTQGSEHNTRLLKPEYFYRLIEFRELEESRKASSDANTKSNIAIFLAIFALVATIVVSYIQQNSSITVNPLQIDQVVKSNLTPENQSVILDQKQFGRIINTFEEKIETQNELLKEIKTKIEKSLNKSNAVVAKKRAND